MKPTWDLDGRITQTTENIHLERHLFRIPREMPSAWGGMGIPKRPRAALKRGLTSNSKTVPSNLEAPGAIGALRLTAGLPDFYRTMGVLLLARWLTLHGSGVASCDRCYGRGHLWPMG